MEKNCGRRQEDFVLWQKRLEDFDFGWTAGGISSVQEIKNQLRDYNTESLHQKIKE